MRLLSRPMPSAPPGARVETVRIQLDIARARSEDAIERADQVIADVATKVERLRKAYAQTGQRLRRKTDAR